MYTMVLYEIGESNESVSLPSKSSGVRGGHHIGWDTIAFKGQIVKVRLTQLLKNA